LIVEERLAACVNISQVRSTFVWEGKVEEEAEDLLIIKTKREVVDELTARIREVHDSRRGRGVPGVDIRVCERAPAPMSRPLKTPEGTLILIFDLMPT